MLTALAAGGRPAYAADDEDVPTINNRGNNEVKWVSRVGTAVVRAARTGPKKIELASYRFEDPDKGRKDLHVKMHWVGGLTETKVVSTFVVKIDVSDEKNWVVLDVPYKDNNKVSPFSPNRARIRALIKKLNR